MISIIFYITLFLTLFQSYQSSNNNIAYNIPDPDCTGVFNLCVDSDKERLGREAIKTIHEQMDDDKDGMIEASESSDFIKEELESQADSIRHSRFQNATLQITFDDLWIQWTQSAVYNWTNDDVIHWLVNFVHLPIYVENFRRNQVDGRMIPRLAANQRHYLSAIMHIRDPRHKRRLIIKATDVVLFGPPQHTHHVIKDIILISALLISFGACLYAFVRHRKTQESMKAMIKELETLQKAESDLISVTGKMKAMEIELQDKEKVDRGVLNSWYLEIQRLKEEADKYRKRRDSIIDNESQLRLAIKENEQLRLALRRAEEHAQHQSYEPPSELIDLLKRTYHVEEMAFETKRKSAEAAMLTAKEQMNKISKMQRGFFGAVRIAHTGCMDNITELISSAKQRLAMVQNEYEEREKRWNRIAQLLDREDFIGSGSSSSSSSATSGNQYLNPMPYSTPANGNSNTLSSDSSSRSKRLTGDSNALLNPNSDTISMRKVASNTNIRGSASNSSYQSPPAQLDTKSDTDSSPDCLNSPPTTLRQRSGTNTTMSTERSSADRLLNVSNLIYSHSTNGLNNLDSNLTGGSSADLSDHLSLANQTKSFVGTIANFHLDPNDPLLDDNQQYDRKSQYSEFLTDDQQSTSSVERSTRQMIKAKLFKSFHNKRISKND